MPSIDSMKNRDRDMDKTIGKTIDETNEASDNTVKKGFFHRKKNRQALEEERHRKRVGVGINGTPAYVGSNRLYFVLTNAIINYLVVIGTAGCFLNAFDVKYSLFAILISGAVMALFTALLYYNNFVKSVGYILSFSGFIYGIVNLQYMIKGGFGHILNHMMEFLEREFNLRLERSYDIYGYSETISVTVCVIFIMFATMLMFNMAISETKGYALVFMFTFPIVQMGMYFDLVINLSFFAAYTTGIFTLFFLRTSRHYHIESKRKKGYQKRKRKNQVVFDYVNDGKYTFSFVIMMIALVGVFAALMGVIYPQKNFQMNSRYEGLKADTRDFAERLATVGFWGMLNPQGAAGGVGRSKMGQSKYVRLDYQDDLLVRTLVEKGENSIYLKAFNGTFYNDAYWETISEHKGEVVSLKDYDLDADELVNLTNNLVIGNYNNGYIGKAKKIEVVNLGAEPYYNYIPSYPMAKLRTLFRAVNDDETIGGLGIDYTMTINYRPLKYISSVDEFRENIKKDNEEAYELAKEQELTEIINTMDMERRYAEYVHEMYMDVPEENLETIKNFCEKYGLDSNSEDIVETVAEIFEEDYEYTLMPGVTPSKEEFVNYFLEESKKGYCMYFASASTLIFRYLGIPARFAGGYVLFANEFDGGTEIKPENEDELSDWVFTAADLKETFPYGLKEYEVDDSMAHAWVEIYIDGFGWIPVETTPPGDDERNEATPEDDTGVLDFFADNVFNAQNMRNVRNFSVGISLVLLMSALLFIVLYIIAGIIVRVRRKNSRSVVKLYEYLCRCTIFKGVIKLPTMSYEEYAERIVENGVMNEESISTVTRIIEKEKFSGTDVQQTETDYVSGEVNRTADEIYAGLKWYKKLVYRYIKWL